jgi:hypothetical protein
MFYFAREGDISKLNACFNEAYDSINDRDDQVRAKCNRSSELMETY